MARVKTPKEREKRDVAKLAGLEKLGASRIDLWRYYSDRADKFAEQLWTTGTWMLGIISVILTLPFTADFVVIDSANFIKFESRILTIAICIFGAMLCGYSYNVLTDIRQHIQRNWERADLVRTGTWTQSDWGKAKYRGWWIIMVYGGCSMFAFVGLACLACFW